LQGRRRSGFKESLPLAVHPQHPLRPANLVTPSSVTMASTPPLYTRMQAFHHNPPTSSTATTALYEFSESTLTWHDCVHIPAVHQDAQPRVDQLAVQRQDGAQHVAPAAQGVIGK